MPELPEVETIVSELRPKLKNKKITRVQVNLSKMISLGPETLPNLRKIDGSLSKKFKKILKGKKISGIARRAKMIIIDLSGEFSILIHLKMTGQLIFLDKKNLNTPVRLLNRPNAKASTLPAKSTHVIFEISDGSKLFYNDFRQFGYLKLVSDKELPNVKELQEYGPEPLEKQFTYKVFEQILNRRPKSQLKLLLTDPKAIAGIGNIYSDEILYFAKVRPTRYASNLNPKEKMALFKGIKVILTNAVRKHGSSVGDFVRPSGEWGSYGSQHKVYGRSGEKCSACGSIIQSIKFNGRTSSYCPREQK